METFLNQILEQFLEYTNSSHYFEFVQHQFEVSPYVLVLYLLFYFILFICVILSSFLHTKHGLVLNQPWKKLVILVFIFMTFTLNPYCSYQDCGSGIHTWLVMSPLNPTLTSNVQHSIILKSQKMNKNRTQFVGFFQELNRASMEL